MAATHVGWTSGVEVSDERSGIKFHHVNRTIGEVWPSADARVDRWKSQLRLLVLTYMLKSLLRPALPLLARPAPRLFATPLPRMSPYSVVATDSASNLSITYPS